MEFVGLLKVPLSKETASFKDYWARVTLGDLEVLVSDIPIIEESYKDAIAIAENNWFYLDSSRQQLLLLRDLCFRPKEVEAAIKIFDRALEKIEKPEIRMKPKSVFLFSGHMIDAPGRTEQRFPNDKKYIDIAANAIAAKLEALGANKDDLALCGGACGGDLLFAEACLERDLHLEVRIPFEEPTFLRKSVSFAGEIWQERFYKVKNNPKTKLYVMPYELVMTPKGIDAYARNNLWQLYTALSYTPEEHLKECVSYACGIVKKAMVLVVQKICTIKFQSTLVRYIYLIQMNFLKIHESILTKKG